MKSPVFESASPWRLRTRLIVAAAAFFGSLLLELWIALPQGLATEFFGVPSTTSVSDLLPILGGSDAGSYLGAALDLQDGSLSPAYQWVLNLWPPGMPVILAVLLKIGGGASPVVAMVVILCVLWSTVMTAVAVIFLPRRAYVTVAVFTIVWILSPIFTGWTTKGGVLGSDGLATALGSLVAIGFLWATFAEKPARPRYALFVLLGIGLAALAYLRIMWFYAVPAALAVLLVVVALRLLILRLRRRPTGIAENRNGYLSWVALAGTFLALCAPWTVYGEAVLHPGSYSWSQGDYQWAQLWMTDDYLNNNGAGFLETGGANWPCDIDPDRCEELADEELSTDAPYGGQGQNTFSTFQREAILVAITNPGPFVVDRTDYTIRAWLSEPGASVGTFGNVGFGIATLVMFLASLAVLVVWTIRRRAAGPLLIFLILGANLGVVWLTHFETRYVVPLQAMSLIVTAFWLAPRESRLWSRLSNARAERQAGQTAATTADEAPAATSAPTE